jgi:hypothetical protein
VNRAEAVHRSFFLIRPTGDVTKDVFTVNVVAHFDGRPKKEDMYEFTHFTGEQLLSMVDTRKECDGLGGTAINPFVSNPTGVYLVSMWKSPTIPHQYNPTPDDFVLLLGSDATLVTDLSEQHRINLMQILAAEREGEELTNVVSQLGLPSCDVDCGANGAICATVDMPFTNGCVCPTLSSWSTEGNTLSCDDSVAFASIVPGSHYVNHFETRDTWQRGTRATVSWSVAGTPRPVQLHLVPVDAQDTVVAEPLVFSLSADQVAEESFEIELPFDFAPHASHAHVAFATPDAAEVGPSSWGRYTSVGEKFVLAGTGCIVGEFHGECVPRGACGGPTDDGRIDGGVGTCASVATSSPTVVATCCVPRLTPTALPAGSITGPMFLLPETDLVAYVGSKVTLRFVIPETDAYWHVRTAVNGSMYRTEVIDNVVSTILKHGETVFLIAESTDLPLLVDQMTVEGVTYNIWEAIFPVYTLYGDVTNSLAAELGKLQIAIDHVVVAEVDLTVRYPPCAPSRESDGFAFFGETDFTTVNTVGQCVAGRSCSDAEETEANSFFFIDTEDLCGASLGDKVVCCRSAEPANDGFRAANQEGPSGSLSTVAIIAIAAGSLCFLALCAALCCATVLIAKRRRTAVTAAPLATRVHAQPRSRRVSRRPSAAHV